MLWMSGYGTSLWTVDDVSALQFFIIARKLNQPKSGTGSRLFSSDLTEGLWD